MTQLELLLETPVEESPIESVPQISDDLQQAFDKLFQDGVLMNLHISIWGMAHKLKEDDLGIEHQPEIIKLGKKMLIDPKILNKFKKIEVAARSYLKNHSFHFDVANAHFVNKKQFAVVIRELEKFKQEFQQELDSFVVNYEKYKNEHLAKYPEFADKLLAYYPDPKEISKKFGFRYTTLRLAVPAELSDYGLEEHMLNETAKREIQERLEGQARQQLDMTMEFVTEAAATIRKKVYEYFTVVSNKVADKGYVSETTIKGIINQIEEFRTLNFTGDVEVEKRLENLETLLSSGKSFETPYDITNVEELETALDFVVQAAKNTDDLNEVTDKYISVNKC